MEDSSHVLYTAGGGGGSRYGSQSGGSFVYLRIFFGFHVCAERIVTGSNPLTSPVLSPVVPVVTGCRAMTA